MEQDFISAEAFIGIQSKSKNLLSLRAYQEEEEAFLIKAKLSKEISSLYIVEHNKDNLRVAKTAGEIFLLFAKSNMLVFDKYDLQFVWDTFIRNETKPQVADLFLELLNQNNKDFIKYRRTSYLIASIYISGYNPHSFLNEMIKEREGIDELKKWKEEEKKNDEPICENRGAVDEEEAMEIFRQEIKHNNCDKNITIEEDGIDLINGVFVVGFYVYNKLLSERIYHEFSVKQIQKIDYEKCKIKK